MDQKRRKTSEEMVAEARARLADDHLDDDETTVDSSWSASSVADARKDDAGSADGRRGDEGLNEQAATESVDFESDHTQAEPSVAERSSRPAEPTPVWYRQTHAGRSEGELPADYTMSDSDPWTTGQPDDLAKRAGRRYLIAGLALFVGLLGVIFAISLVGAQRGEDGAIVEAGDLDVFSVQVGDCFNDPDETDVVYSVDAIPCEQPHDNEVFAVDAVATSLGSDFPGEEQMFEFAQDYCTGAPFEGYVGIDYWESDLAVWTFTPTLESWAEGDREIVCILYRLDLAKMTGTARNTSA